MSLLILLLWLAILVLLGGLGWDSYKAYQRAKASR